MGTYNYKAVNAEGKFVEGRLEAADTRVAATRLQAQGLVPVSIDEPREKGTRSLSGFQFQWITRRDILFFTEELTTLVRAGLPLDRALSVTAELTAKPAFRAIILDVLKQIKGGKSLAEALSAHPKQFSRLYVNMIRAGEAGGVLEIILERLAEFERSADEMRSYLVSSLVYPCLLTGVGLGSVGILFYFVIPKFAAIFQDLGVPVPPATQVLLSLSTFTTSYWWLALLVIGLTVLGVRSWVKTPKGSRAWDSLMLRVPLLGATILKIEVARFARTLGTLTASAVPLIAGVRIVHDIARNQLVAEGISKIAAGAKRGEGVAKPMRDSGVFPGLAVHLVEVGEETGRLDTMLLQIADVYEKDVRTSVKALTSVFEPAIILVMGVLVGAVVLSILMAITSIADIGL
jgi:general secretion pathway protein F